MAKLAVASWGYHVCTHWTTALALMFSVIEYFAHVWIRNAHCKKVDVQLNHTMHIISGIVRSTQTVWFLIHPNIAPIPDYKDATKTLQPV